MRLERDAIACGESASDAFADAHRGKWLDFGEPATGAGSLGAEVGHDVSVMSGRDPITVIAVPDGRAILCPRRPLQHVTSAVYARGVTEPPSPPRYLPFMDGPAPTDAAAFRWRLGVRPLDLRDWIELGPDAETAIAAKAALSAQHPETVFAVLDDVEPESSEVADALVEHLRWRWPDRYGDAELDESLHPLDAAARLVPEDLVLLVDRGGRLVFGGGSVCFPNRWDLRSKLGLSMAGVHAPVAQLNEQLEAPIDGFFERLTPQRSFWRLGWGVLDTSDWYTPLDGTAAPRPGGPGARRAVPARRTRDAAPIPGHRLRVVHDPHLRHPDPRDRRRSGGRSPPGRRARRTPRGRPGLQGPAIDRGSIDRIAARNCRSKLIDFDSS